MDENVQLLTNFQSFKWYNEPCHWSVKSNGMHLHTEGNTDFWRITHYGFIRDNGHFCYIHQAGSFLASVKIKGHYQALYDQAGLMIRLSEKHWIKTGIEFVGGVQQVSAVVTHDYSDWSVIPLLNPPDFLWLKLLRKGDFVEISYSLDGNSYNMLRLAYFPPEAEVQVGLMAATPEGEGFLVEFENFEIMTI